MNNADTELLFPPRIIPSLRSLRGATWKKLVDQVEKSGENSPAKIGFVLFMVRINGCFSCNADSFRAMHGCTQCTKQAIRRLKEPDKALVRGFEAAKQEVEAHLSSKNEYPLSQEAHDLKSVPNKRRRSGGTR